MRITLDYGVKELILQVLARVLSSTVRQKYQKHMLTKIMRAYYMHTFRLRVHAN